MVAVKTADADRIVARPPDEIFCFLLYGPDGGLAHERAAALAESGVDDTADPFALIRIDGDDLAADPSRLLDEAHTVALFGGRRTLWVRVGGRSPAAAIEACLKGPRPDARIIVEAGDLKKSAPLRTLCERHRNAAAIPCYADNGAGLGRLIDQELAAAGLGIDPDARATLLGLLGADRLASRQELAKLALYAHGRGQISTADLDAVVADSAETALDDLIDAVFAGDIVALERRRGALAAAGLHPGVALNGALTHALRLYRVRIDCDRAGVTAAVSGGWPGLHFRRKAAVEAALGRWSLSRLEQAVARLARAATEARRSAALARTIADRTLVTIAQEARRAGRR